MTKSERNPNDEIRKASARKKASDSEFGFRHSFVIRHSSFVISPTARAFTLMEMLLALAISAIVVAAIGGVFYSALRLRDRTAAALDEMAPLHQVLILLRRDLQGAQPPSGYLAGDFKNGAISGDLGQGVGLQFYTSTGTMSDNSPWADLQQVIYELRPPTQPTRAGGKDLFRTINRSLLGTVQQPDDQWLMGNVQSLDFACYDGNNWLDTWDTSLGNTNLPTAVRVRIQLASDAAGKQEPIELIVPLDSLSRTNQTQSAGGS